MKRPIVFDVTHLTARCRVRPHTGIDRVDIAFADLVSRRWNGQVIGLHCGLFAPHLVRAEHIRKLAEASTAVRVEGDQDSRVKENIRRWMRGEGTVEARSTSSVSDAQSHGIRILWQQARLGVHGNWPLKIAKGAVYLNVAPQGTPGNYYFRWLERRTDVKAVFFVHDFLPLDHPEFFPPAWQPSYRQLLSFMLARGNGFIVASDATRTRLERELSQQGRERTPIAVAPLPPPDGASRPPAVEQALRDHPYFVMTGTLEPRKNHLLVLGVWEKLIEASSDRRVRLVLVGKRGWLNDAALAALDRSGPLRDHVLQLTASDTVQHWLLSNALGALMPSHVEGYGLSLVEALALGLPAIASDIPVFREVGQGCATYCDPNDPVDWLRTISRLSDRSSHAWKDAAARAREFRAPTMAAFTSTITTFLDSL